LALKILSFVFQGFVIYQSDYINLQARLEAAGVSGLPTWSVWQVSGPSIR
jgi:hypothetical protein